MLGYKEQFIENSRIYMENATHIESYRDGSRYILFLMLLICVTSVYLIQRSAEYPSIFSATTIQQGEHESTTIFEEHHILTDEVIENMLGQRQQGTWSIYKMNYNTMNIVWPIIILAMVGFTYILSLRLRENAKALDNQETDFKIVLRNIPTTPLLSSRIWTISLSIMIFVLLPMLSLTLHVNLASEMKSQMTVAIIDIHGRYGDNIAAVPEDITESCKVYPTKVDKNKTFTLCNEKLNTADKMYTRQFFLGAISLVLVFAFGIRCCHSVFLHYKQLY